MLVPPASLALPVDVASLVHRARLRIWGGRGNWHNRRFPPNLRVTPRDGALRFAYRDRTCLAQPAGRAPRAPLSRCHLILSGPSIRSIREPALLGSAPTLCLNGSPRLLLDHGLRPDLYLVDDVRYLTGCHPDFSTFACAAGQVFLSYASFATALGLGPLPAGPDYFVYEQWHQPFRRPSPSGGRTGCHFSLSAENGFGTCGTAAYVALQLALSLGFTDILVFGLDLGGPGRFYAERRPQPSELERELACSILPAFRLLASRLPLLGARILNCSPDSALPDTILPKVDPNAALRAGAGVTAAVG